MRSMMCAICSSVAFSDMLTIIGSLLSFPVSLHADAHPSGCTFIAYRFLRDSVVKALILQKQKPRSWVAASGSTCWNLVDHWRFDLLASVAAAATWLNQ